MGPEYQGFTPGVVWEKTIGLRFLRLFDGYALGTDIGWIQELTQLVGFLLPWPMRVFGNDERNKAIDWLSSLLEEPGVSHYLISASQIIVVEVPQRAPRADLPGPPPVQHPSRTACAEQARPPGYGITECFTGVISPVPPRSFQAPARTDPADQ